MFREAVFRVLIRCPVSVEHVFEALGAVDGGAFFLDAHEDHFRGVGIEEGEDGGEDGRECVAGVERVVVDEELVCDVRTSNVQIPHAGIELYA